MQLFPLRLAGIRAWRTFCLTTSQYLTININSQVVGRLAGQIATLLQGKHKPSYVPHTDCGDYVVVVNASKVKFTGRKMREKLYRWHTGYPGGLKSRAAWEQLQRNPSKLFRDAVTGMLPKNALRKTAWMKKLRVYSGEEHPHVEEVQACSGSQQYKEHCAPSSKRLYADKQPIPSVTDVEVTEEQEAAAKNPVPEDILQGIFLFRMRETLDAEVQYWAERGEPRVPQRALEEHGLLQTDDNTFKFADSGEVVPPLAELQGFAAILDVLESSDSEQALDKLYARLAAGEDITQAAAAQASGSGR